MGSGLIFGHAQYWTLDGEGNWESFLQFSAPDNYLQQSRETNGANEITGISQQQGQPQWTIPDYDKAGNMTSLPQPNDPENGFTCTYDAWNRLVLVSDGTTAVSYAYDGLGRRIARIAGGTAEHYYYAGQQAVETRSGAPTSDPSTLPPQYQYVWSARSVDAAILRDTYNGQGELQAGDCVYFLNDANGNVTALVDPSGSLVERYVYDPYGKVTFCEPDWTVASSQVSAVGNTVLYAGREIDPTTGLYYNRARWYHPGTGTFLSRDSLGLAAGANLYQYAASDPVDLRDPSGLCPTGDRKWDPGGHTGSPRAPGGSGIDVVNDALMELSELKRLADNWNKTSKGSRWPSYMCGEQAMALQNALSNHTWRYWDLAPVGRSRGWQFLDNTLLSCLWLNVANAVKLVPKNGNPSGPSVLYPWKILPGPSPCRYFTWEQFIEAYPNPEY